MGKFIDITSQKFGRLTAIEKSKTVKNKTHWLFRCDCGNEKIIFKSNVVTGKTISCGCYQSETSTKRHQIDLTGKRFGNLTAIRRVENKFGVKVCWECACDCGKLTAVITNKLTSGLKTKCKECQFTGENCKGWKGGKYKESSGYIYVYAPNHPNKGSKNHVFEHRLVMENHLGRYLLPNENVHHKNGFRDDNRIENLELWAKAQPAGQRVEDLIKFSLEILERYMPEKLN